MEIRFFAPASLVSNLDFVEGIFGNGGDPFLPEKLGCLFETPDQVFPEEMLRPEKQDMEAFAAGVDAIIDTQVRVARTYFDDGSVGAACPPLKALLHVMVHGTGNAWSPNSSATSPCASVG